MPAVAGQAAYVRQTPGHLPIVKIPGTPSDRKEAMTLTKPSRAARRQRIDDLTTFAVPEQPALSPDGNECLYVLRTCDAEADRNVRAIWRVGTRTGRPRQLTHGTADTSPAWSPDGGRIAFLRSRDEVPQIWLLPADGGEAGQLTTLPLGAGAPVWSPDGSKIAFVAVVDPLAAGSDGMSPEVRASAPLVADRLTYQEDGAGLLGAVRRHLHVLDLATGRCRQVTEGTGTPTILPGHRIRNGWRSPRRWLRTRICGPACPCTSST